MRRVPAFLPILASTGLAARDPTTKERAPGGAGIEADAGALGGDLSGGDPAEGTLVGGAAGAATGAATG